MAPNLASCLFFAVVVIGYETFETRCAGPSTKVNFVSSADKRGTLDILFSCLFTLVACTWTVQHLNVPEQREGRDPGWLGNIKWTLKRAWTSTKWMLITLLAPEYLLAKGLSDREAVDRSLTELQEIAAKDGVPWTRVHSQFANMGGFVIRVDGNTVEQKKTVSRSSLYHLTIPDILALREDGSLEKLPSITEEEINDKSKSDGLVRAIAIVQIAWMALQIIARASRRLAISQLEISVLAFASCAVVIYGLNWERPKGVQVPYTLLKYKEDIPPSVLRHLRSNVHGSALEDFVGAMLGFISVSDARSKTPGAPLLNHVSYFTTGSRDSGSPATFSDFLGLMIGSAIFGAIHITAWNFAFPTSTERVIWRVASIFCTSPGFIVLIMALCTFILQDVSPSDLLSNLLVVIFLCALKLFCFGYVVARLFMIVVTFRTLCFLPPSAYIATWASSNVPHVA